MKKAFILVFCFGLFNITGFTQQKPIKIKADRTQSVVTYRVRHPLHKVKGIDKKVGALIYYDPQSKQIKNAAVILTLADFDSGNGNRDSHALEALEANKYPLVTFTSSSIQQGKDSLLISGVLDFHNVKQNISFKAVKKIQGKNLNIIGHFSVDMTQYKVKPPKIMFMKTDKTIKLNFNLIFRLP